MGLLQTITDTLQGKTSNFESRSGEWPRVRALWLKDHSTCAACGGKNKLEVHHKKPFHVHPELELDNTNFITLCESDNNGVNCHLLFGHLGNFESVNLDVEVDATTWLQKITFRVTNASLLN
jgi:5-methylcytosine-specific restriction enzyme A